MRHKDIEWYLSNMPCATAEAQLAVLMDLRDELKAIRRLAECPNVQAGFIAMQQVAKNTKKHPRSKK